MNISSRFIKLSGNFEIPEDLTIGRDYKLEIEGSITACTEKSDEQGGMELEYRFRPLLGAILGDSGASIKLKDRASKSFRLRTMIIREFGMEYEQAMDKLMSDPERLRLFIEENL